jgi:SAM-dependent methyltransferase
MALISNEMYTSDVYINNNPTWDDEGTAWKAGIIHGLLQMNGITPETIVEVGCGAGGILRELADMDTTIQHLTGYDISRAAIELAAQKKKDRVAYFHSDFINSKEPGGDVLLVIDVIEHIDDFYGFLNKLKNRSKHVVFHVPLDLSCRNILKPHTMLLQRKLVGHLHYFSKEMVEWVLQDTGFTIIDWIYTKPEIDTQKASSLKAVIKKLLRRVSFAINKDWSAKMWGGYSMMILAK